MPGEATTAHPEAGHTDMLLHTWMEYAVEILGTLGTLILIYGVLVCVFRFVRSEIKCLGGADIEHERKEIRIHLGYYILLGLEFLVAADVVETILDPGWEELGILGGIVLIRTVISFSLNWELAHEKKAE